MTAPLINPGRTVPSNHALPAGEGVLSITQTAQLSGVCEDDLLGLVEYGVLTPSAADDERRSFDIGCVMKLQRAALMRQDLALDPHSFALAVMFLNEISGLESELQKTQRELSDYRSLMAIDHTRA